MNGEPAVGLGSSHSQASVPMSSNGQQVDQQQHCSPTQSQPKRRQRSGRAPKHPSSRTYSHSNRRIYDVRIWHRRRPIDKLRNVDWGQPPAGWVLVWAGRFKRWRRRWFVVHPAGLLLYYKNSEQLGRPGCISLQGAEVSGTSGKERQFKIRRGTILYYLRTLKKENRQAWLETIHRSIGTYEKSWRKVGIGSKSGKALNVQQSVPMHLEEEWKQQETEVNRRLSEKLRELEPMQQAFLQQVQVVQQSLSVLAEAFGLGGSLVTKVETSPSLGPRDRCRPSYSPPLYPCPNGKFLAAKSKGFSKTGLTSSLSEPIPCFESNEYLLGEHSSNQQTIAEDGGGVSQIKQGGCMGRELFRMRRRESNGTTIAEKGHSSDTEVCCSSSYNRDPASRKDKREGIKLVNAKFPTSHSLDSFPSTFTRSPAKETDCEPNKDETAHCKSQKVSNCDIHKGTTDIHPPLPVSVNYPGHTIMQGQLHAAWNTMQETFAELLKEEIRRVIELEAENAALQQSLVMLPQLQQDHKDLLDLRERLQGNKSNRVIRTEDRDMDGTFGDDEDTDDEVSLAASDVTNEDYYEALEVLNQHDFIAKSTRSEELEVLGEAIDFSQEPTEDGDLSNDMDNLSELEADDDDQPRSRLPAPRPLQRGFSLWSVLKTAIGKDLNHITMPATINEPLSVLQRCAEELQYSHLLEKASQLEDSVERLVWVSVFACASYHGSLHRDAKPFNPLLGETYEWQSVDGRLRFIAEQVSHHPPILGFHSENLSSNYTIYGEVEVKNRFWGKSVEVFPVGQVHLRMPKFGDHFTWSKITTCIHNVIVGKLWIDNYGELVIHNHATGEISRIRIYKATSKEQGRITGKVFDKKGILTCSLLGNYMKQITIIPEPFWDRKSFYGDARCLWKPPAPPEDYEQQYCFSRFTIGLNEMTSELRDSLPPTDSRFRPDQRALEDGDLEKATPEKIRLEEKQREAFRRRRENGQEWTCMWFKQRVAGISQVKMAGETDEEPSWVYNGEYWKARDKHDWGRCPGIM